MTCFSLIYLLFIYVFVHLFILTDAGLCPLPDTPVCANGSRCDNGGTVIFGFDCLCSPGFAGEKCEIGKYIISEI